MMNQYLHGRVQRAIKKEEKLVSTVKKRWGLIKSFISKEANPALESFCLTLYSTLEFGYQGYNEV